MTVHGFRIKLVYCITILSVQRLRIEPSKFLLCPIKMFNGPDPLIQFNGSEVRNCVL